MWCAFCSILQLLHEVMQIPHHIHLVLSQVHSTTSIAPRSQICFPLPASTNPGHLSAEMLTRDGGEGEKLVHHRIRLALSPNDQSYSPSLLSISFPSILNWFSCLSISCTELALPHATAADFLSHACTLITGIRMKSISATCMRGCLSHSHIAPPLCH